MAFEKQPTPIIETQNKNFIENEINTTIQDTKNQSQELKQEVEQQMPQLSGFMKIVYENNREVYNTMAQKITSTKKPTSDGTIEYYTVEEWSETIEHTRGQITLGTLDPQLQEHIKANPQLLHSIETGSSLYLTNWLNNLSSSELQQVGSIGTDIKGMISKATDLMGIFKNLTSFKNQMKSINTVFEGMDIYNKELLSNPTREITQLPAFQTPEGFARLLTKHTPTSVSTPESGNKSFDEYFDITGAQLDINKVIADMKYGDKQHELMTKVITMGPQILEKRVQLQGTFGEVYAQISEVANLFTGGKPLSEAIQGTFLGNVTNFVCALLGFGSLKQMERRGILKEFNKNCPELQRKGIEHSLAYISQLAGQESYMTNNGFERYLGNISDEDKNKIISILPNEQLLKDSFSDAVEKTGFFVHPSVLQQAGVVNYLNYYNFEKETNTYTLKPELQSEYNQLLLTNKDKICESGRGSLLQPTILNDMIESGRSQADMASYLMSGLSFPGYALEISRNNLVSASTVIIENTLSQSNEQLDAERIKKIEAKKEELKKEEEKLAIIKEAKGDTKEVETKIEALKKEIADLEGKTSPLTQEQLDNNEKVDYNKIFETIVDKIEGGYYHPNMNMKAMGKSGETMMGIDRIHGGKLNTSEAGEKFRALIDQDKKEHPDLWKHNYKGGQYETQLKTLVGEIMGPHYENLCQKYLSKKTLTLVKGNYDLSFNLAYGARNGSGWFKKLADELNSKTSAGITDTKILSQTLIDFRIHKSNNSLIAKSGEKIQDILA